jgi:hypothetical protein
MPTVVSSVALNAPRELAASIMALSDAMSATVSCLCSILIFNDNDCGSQIKTPVNAVFWQDWLNA